MNVPVAGLPSRLAGLEAPRIPGWAHAVIASVLLAAAVAAVTVGQPYQERVLRGENDFPAQFAGAALIGSPNLYSPEAVTRLQLARAGVWMRGGYYCRLPFYAFLLRPLASLPYFYAYWLFQSLNLVCCALFAYVLVVSQRSEYLVWLPLFLPALIAFVNGQDLMIVLLFCALFLLLAHRDRDLAAGACLSLCLIKFHLFAFVPIVILAHRRWRLLLGGIAGSAFWLGVSFAFAGADWPMRYLRLLRNPEIHPGLDRMPTIFGVLRSFDVGTPVAAAAVIVCGALFVFAVFRIKDFEASVGLALIAGIVLSVHAYTQDCTLLLLSIPLVAGQSLFSSSLRALLLTPVPYLGTLAGKPWNVVLPAALVAFSTVAVFDSLRHSQAVPRKASSEAAQAPIERTETPLASGAESRGGAL